MAQPNEEHIQVSLDQPTGNFWIDNGLVVLVRELGEGEHKLGDLVSHVADKLTSDGRWARPANELINAQANPWSTFANIRKNEEFCDFCGELGRTIDAKTWSYPFIVAKDKFRNFYAGGKRSLRMCARCGVAGLASYLGWITRTHGPDVFHFFVFHAELRELERIYGEDLEQLQLEASSGGSAPFAFFGPYVHETLFGLLLELFQQIHGSDDDDSDTSQETARQHLAWLIGDLDRTTASPVRLYAVTGKPGQSFDMQAFTEFAKFQPLYQLYEGWLTRLRDRGEANPPQKTKQVFRQFQTQQSERWETRWRNQIAQAVLTFGDPLPSVAAFLFEARVKEEAPRPLAWGTMDLVSHYAEEVLHMDGKLQRTLAGFGSSLGEAAQANSEMGLLYALRNSKRPEEFLRVLNDIQFRLDLTVPEPLLALERGERISGSSWHRVKTVLAIHAMNKFLRCQSNSQQRTSASAEADGEET